MTEDRFKIIIEEAEQLDIETLEKEIKKLRAEDERVGIRACAYEEALRHVRTRKMIESGALQSITWKLVFGEKMKTCWLRAMTRGYEPKVIFDLAGSDHDMMEMHDDLGTVLHFDDGDLFLQTNGNMLGEARRPADTAKLIHKYELSVDMSDLDGAISKLEEDVRALRELRGVIES
jgi:hypothetical protein